MYSIETLSLIGHSGVAHLTPQAEVWDEDRTPFRPQLVLDAGTYRAEPVFDLPASRHDSGRYLVSPNGTFAYQNRILPVGTPLRLYGKQAGIVRWTCDVTIPTLIDMKRHSRTGEPFDAYISEWYRVVYGAVWMSLTPMEMITQRPGVELARGTVVIGGLGLGWLLRKVCEKPEVERVVVVEKSQELLDWYGYAMCGRFGKVSEVICDDVYNQLGRHGDDARYLLDIWHLYTGAANDPRLREAKQQLKGRLWAWGT